jgi:hypothetical protein
MNTFITFTDGKLNTDGEEVLTFGSEAQARHAFAHAYSQRELTFDTAQELKEINRFEYGTRFTFTVYDHNGEYMRAFDCHLDEDDGGWVCADSEFSDTTMIYYEVAEQAQCELNEINAHVGIYQVLDFECDCETVGSQYAWIISAV